ncbi:MAG: hypothetical protein K8M05_32335 [Deltaproteobacteria bacterium]|nr:hypothetical protein [Kofleriaceae bacterium]
MRLGIALACASVLAAAAAPARAEPQFPESKLVGPLLGIAWGNGHAAHPTLGVEGGIGLDEVIILNAGSTWRGGELFSYLELDGWFFLGATAGYGHGTRDGWQAVVGVWEPLPPKVLEGGCDDARVVAFSVGYRYTGLHELYFTAKYGDAWEPCWD